MVYSYPIISFVVLFTLMTPYIYCMGHDSNSSRTEIGQKLLKTVFLVIFIAKTSSSTYNIVSWANEWGFECKKHHE
jgi:hypothetical protein